MSWHLTIEISGNSYEALKSAADICSQRIKETKSFKELSDLNQGHTDSSGMGWSFHTKCTSPVAARIKALREEADKLEHELKSTA